MGHHAPRRRRLTDMEARGGITRQGWQVSSEIFPARAVDPELAEVGRRLFAKEARFIAGAPEPSALPPESLPEVAFAGRSNVGKSSLINALTGRRMLARTSNTPGRTRQINFFDLGGRLLLVDLPGYGYAEASKAAIKSWTELVQRYLRTRAKLRRVCFLVDARHGIKEVDRPLMNMLDAAGVAYQIVLTKTDKVGTEELTLILEKVVTQLAARVAAHPEIHLTSAVDRRGIAELHESLGELATPIEKLRLR
jgi:GTP-binding protein